jgi:hypothetical protein
MIPWGSLVLGGKGLAIEILKYFSLALPLEGLRFVTPSHFPCSGKACRLRCAEARNRIGPLKSQEYFSPLPLRSMRLGWPLLVHRKPLRS